ncbi:DUF3027 domain-containing protein [Streptomyces acidiscabies]|uniref:DUF3027 domain-containing protein n=1 Tax=Streptomyces acidiscabies TaxID=42234 RepID=A0AAP6EHM7_9ACTN|nr:DUF3027 domain-containing protein [Streptomyces acidiscabies]MBP5938837.1 DUF3027 domain-containing protein [Streptomyces sp. LBUM 1476]MBZ3909954.1 DUF3027 domain-containing protein [Streptomyces acidiscabies]MDX2962571.1 DUF3027 domain-containing protein [Streptomyces acidiscabies]MDX3020484.1 DUF3027 domain-containing protein [Streptomyces acidiscabies]MDX3789952.1 DUF3027 domain-containing protein [Streptomyces acidiscabies]
MSAATTRSRTPDRLCAEAVDLARTAAEEAAAPGVVGEHVGLVSEGDRVVTHFFECKELGYRGWRWAATVARASRAKVVTLDEVVMLPGPDAVLAPEWVPWSERLRPGDLGPGDLLPTDADDDRLESGYADDRLALGDSGDDEPELELTAAASADAEDTPDLAVPPARGTIAAVADELGLRRARVLSRYGLHIAADRWEEAFGAQTPMAQAAPATCVSCGFLTPIGGSLGRAFGVCANEFSPADGRVVSLTYGCGGHSEAAVMPAPTRPALPVVDETQVDPFPLRPAADSGSVPVGDGDEETAELGHS